MNHRDERLGSAPLGKLMFSLALPSVAAQLINVLYNIVDRMYIGHIPGYGNAALTGVGVTFPILTMISAFSAFAGMGGAPLASIQLGKQNRQRAEQILGNSAGLLVLFSVILTAFFSIFKTPVLYAFGASDATIVYARDYISIYLIGTIFVQLALGLNAYISGQGAAKIAMLSVLIGAVLNICLDPLFIFVLHMGVRGAAVATVLSQAASCAFSLYILFRGPVPVKITFRGYSLPVCRDVLTLGLTPFLIILFDNVLIIVQNVMLKNYGGADSDMLLTCNTIVQSFMLIITMPLSGISGGTQSVLGYNYGAGDTARIRLAEKHILKTALLFCTIMFVFAQWDVSAGIFVGLFTQNAAYRSMTVHFIHIYTLSVIPLAVQYALVDGLTGMSLVGASLPLSFFRKGIYIALAVFLPIRFGAPAMFYAEPLSDVVAAVVTTIVFVTVVPGLLRKREALLGKHIEK